MLIFAILNADTRHLESCISIVSCWNLEAFLFFFFFFFFCLFPSIKRMFSRITRQLCTAAPRASRSFSTATRTVREKPGQFLMGLVAGATSVAIFAVGVETASAERGAVTVISTGERGSHVDILNKFLGLDQGNVIQVWFFFNIYLYTFKSFLQ